jgi:hypothetical protein
MALASVSGKLLLAYTSTIILCSRPAWPMTIFFYLMTLTALAMVSRSGEFLLVFGSGSHGTWVSLAVIKDWLENSAPISSYTVVCIFVITEMYFNKPLDSPTCLCNTSQTPNFCFSSIISHCSTRLSTASNAPASSTITALPHQVATASLLHFMQGLNVVVYWGTTMVLLLCPVMAHSAPNPQTHHRHSRHPAPG